MKRNKATFAIISFFLVFIVVPTPAFAHGGGLDAQGGHIDKKTGEYHLHQKQQAGPAPGSLVGAGGGTRQNSITWVSRTPAIPEKQLIGVASVIDGDTIEIHGQRIRFHGIDAPESKQTCMLDGKPWRCGAEAANRLSEKIGQQTVTCNERDKDRYGRVVSVCSAGGQDLNAWMVAEGLAVAYRKYSSDYAGEHNEAMAARRGVWASEFDMPWDWRKGNK